MQNKKNSKIISKLVLSTTAAFMATMAVKATEEPNDVQSQVENFQQEDQLQVAYDKVSTVDSVTQIEGVNTTDKGVVYNKTTGNVEGYTDTIVSDVKIDDSITVDSNPVSVTAIADYAFDDCNKLVSVEIPDSVKTIGEGAFSECSKLKFVRFVDGEKITTVGKDAFDTEKIKYVYINDTEKSKEVSNIKKLGIKDSQIREYNESIPTSAPTAVALLSSTPESSDGGVKLVWEYKRGNTSDMYVIERTNSEGTKETVGVVYPSSVTNNKIEFVDDSAVLGETYDYVVTPYAIHEDYGTLLTAKNFEEYSKDPFGIRAGTGVGTYSNFQFKNYTVDDITSTYTEVTTVDGKTVKGAYSDIGDSKIASVYSIAKNRYAVNFGNGKPATVSGSDINELSDPLLYVREWDIKDDSTDKKNWEEQASLKTENKISSAGVSRVFSLQIVEDNQGDSAITSGSLVGSDDYCANVLKLKNGSVADEIPVYIQIDESWGSNLGAVAVSETNQDTVLENISILSDAERIKAGLPEGRYAKLVLDKFYYGPYAIYADKLENAGTNNSELCETCGKQKDECTCEKKDEETKPEDTTKEDNKNNASGTNGTQTGGNTSSGTSHGYKTGDVASAGLLQSAFGMLAAAGSTLMGLFRKKKDRE